MIIHLNQRAGDMAESRMPAVVALEKGGLVILRTIINTLPSLTRRKEQEGHLFIAHQEERKKSLS
jgi:hypothetical protein